MLIYVEQKDIEGRHKLHMCDAVKWEVDAITKRNKNEPEQRRAEVAAIKQVFRRLYLFLRIITSLLCVMFMSAVF
jgi:hypothetical protein